MQAELCENMHSSTHICYSDCLLEDKEELRNYSHTQKKRKEKKKRTVGLKNVM